MKVFKFGGASVKSSEGVRNVATILENFSSDQLLVVISAMGKTTNALEELTHAYYHQTGKATQILDQIKEYHGKIIDELSENTPFPFFHDVDSLFLELECLIDTKNFKHDYDFIYDQIVCFGELISTRIVSSYLLSIGVTNQWIDARNFIMTDSRHREGKLQWDETSQLIQNRLKPLAKRSLIVTQGFIGRDSNNATVTLGREGSDYSAAIFASSLSAESLTIWKDVAGVMNADPKKFPFATLLPSLNYNDTIELAYYGASVIHPKTVQPLKKHNIPLFVNSFLDIHATGTVVSTTAPQLTLPCYIHKSGQTMGSISSKDYTFIAEDHLREIFACLSDCKIRCNIMQNSALRFSFIFDHNDARMEKLSEMISERGMEIQFTPNLEMLSVYNPQQARIDELLTGKLVKMEQQLGNALHYVYSSSI